MNSIKVGGLCLVVIVALAGCVTAPTPPESEGQDEQAVLEASFSEAVQAMEQDNLAEARTRFEQLARDYPDKAGPMANLGIIAFQEGDTEAATQWFERALAANPGQVQALNHLGVIARNAGEFDEAERYYRAALAADQDYAPVILNLAFLLDIYLGKPADAVELYERYQSAASEPHPRLEDWIFDAKNRI
ncbi:tetratricopeptide repeat protein [uncultured Marinobacter sp.]|uniref:tetratricopeptide repeat protein n=1 Tax=uncultured Marinobacter sp. TaxID=187379 RepID=UPI0025D23AB8|nr:tetratricopeptide repeat protein [uncultured Marinobacter sp.]